GGVRGGGVRGREGRGGREKGEGRGEKGEGRRETGEGRGEKGEGRRERGEGRGERVIPTERRRREWRDLLFDGSRSLDFAALRAAPLGMTPLSPLPFPLSLFPLSPFRFSLLLLRVVASADDRRVARQVQLLALAHDHQLLRQRGDVLHRVVQVE